MLTYLVDAFTEKRLEGNPAGVILDADLLSREEKQKLAREIHASETAFVSRSDVADFKVKFFTPTTEVDFCGHATVATFWLLAETDRLGVTERSVTVMQETRAGILPVTINRRDGRIYVSMTQRLPQFLTPNLTQMEVARSLGIEPANLDSAFPIRFANTANWHLMIGVRTLECLNSIKYDTALLSSILSAQKAVTAHVFCAESKLVYHARNFCPTYGIVEDPATGAAAGAFGAYLAAERLIEDGTSEVQILQGEAMGRPSQIVSRVTATNGSVTEVQVSGTATFSFLLSSEKEATHRSKSAAKI
jgi:PhzF family phenazine biosynthesis protein